MRSTPATWSSVCASRIMISSSTPIVSGGTEPNRCAITSLRADAVHGPPGREPGVVGSAGAELRAIADDARVAAHVARAPRLLEQVGVVLLLPDEDQVRGGHELGDERAARCGTRERIGAHAPPPVVVVSVVLLPELGVDDERLLEDDLSLLHPGTRVAARCNDGDGRSKTNEPGETSSPPAQGAWPRPGQAG